MIDSFAAQLVDNSCVVHRVRAVDEAMALLVERAHALDLKSVAIPTAGPVLDPQELISKFGAHGFDVLTPDDGAWSSKLPLVDAGVTGARLAVGEPAAIALTCGPGAPRAVSLVPPVHLCAVRVADIVPTLGDALSALAGEGLPSAVTWIGGPSRTGDLEMIQTLGVHGPRRVEVVLIADG
jgi:L-lactate dehydrogenase complex protein LldG